MRPARKGRSPRRLGGWPLDRARAHAEGRRAGRERRRQVLHDTLIAESRRTEARRQEAGQVWERELRLSPALVPALAANNAPACGLAGEREAGQARRIADRYVADGIVPGVRDARLRLG